MFVTGTPRFFFLQRLKTRMPSHSKDKSADKDKEKWSDKMKRVFKNGLAPVLDDGGHKIGGVPGRRSSTPKSSARL